MPIPDYITTVRLYGYLIWKDSGNSNYCPEFNFNPLRPIPCTFLTVNYMAGRLP